jgi:hypothetical protein
MSKAAKEMDAVEAELDIAHLAAVIVGR